MKKILVSLRVTEAQTYKERRDALDQRWFDFLLACNLLPVLLPNHLPTVQAIVAENDFSGILLTGGNSLAKYGGDAPERDEIESYLTHFAVTHAIPLLGVCRGMQVIQDYFDEELFPISGHVQKEQTIMIYDCPMTVNSYHNQGTTQMTEIFNVWAKAEDNIVKAISHKEYPLTGIMWHPERLSPFRDDDVRLFKEFFTA